MRWLALLLALTFALPGFAGEIVVGHCSYCGYETQELAVGTCSVPNYSASIYFDTEHGMYHEVGFNILMIAADQIAVNINQDHREVGELTAESIYSSITSVLGKLNPEIAEKIAVTINNNHREVDEITPQSVAVIVSDVYMEMTDPSMCYWEAPESLGQLIHEGRLPAGVILGEEYTGDENLREWGLIEGGGMCPECGSPIDFEQVGAWD